MKKHRFVIALIGLSLFAVSSTVAADMTQANIDQQVVDRKSTRLNSSNRSLSRMPSSA